VDGDGDDNERRSSLIHISVGHRRPTKVPRECPTRLAKHVVDHRRVQLAGIRILPARVIAPNGELVASTIRGERGRGPDASPRILNS
jgi:hypothetical protein